MYMYVYVFVSLSLSFMVGFIRRTDHLSRSGRDAFRKGRRGPHLVTRPLERLYFKNEDLHDY